MSGQGELVTRTAKAAASTPTFAMTSFREHNHAERIFMSSPRRCQRSVRQMRLAASAMMPTKPITSAIGANP